MSNPATDRSPLPTTTLAPGPGGLPWLTAGVALAASLAAPGPMIRAAPWLFLASALVLGLPHGAADPWVPQWVRGSGGGAWTTLRPWVRFLAFYSLAVGATLAAWRWARPETTVGFLLLTAWHWGSADASGTLGPRTRRWAGLALGRGLVVVAGPLALRPAAEGRTVLNALAGSAAAGEAIAATAWPLLGVGMLLEAIVLSLTALDAVAAGGRNPGQKTWRRPGRHALETVILLTLFRFLPTVASVGVYFVGFHAWRHVERLAALQPSTTAGSFPGRLGTFYRRVWPFALGALAMLPVLHRWIARPVTEPGGGDWLTSYLILLSALTVPHAFVVFRWLDRSPMGRTR